MKNAKLIVLVLLAVSAVVGGIARQITEPGQLFAQADIPFFFLDVALIFTWFRIDANQRGYKRSPTLNVAVIALTLVALPYYFFRSRGFVGGLIATGIFVAAAILSGILQYAGSYAVYVASQS